MSIEQQLAVAREKYPNLQQTKPNELTIEFPNAPGSLFVILIPQNYPNGAPNIYVRFAGDVNFISLTLFPVVAKWNPFFTIADVLDSIAVYSRIPRPTPFLVNPNDVNSAIQSVQPYQLASPDIKKQIVEMVCQKAIQSKERVESKQQALASENSNSQQSVLQNINGIQTILQQKQQVIAEMNNISSQMPNLMIIAKQKKIQSLLEEAAGADVYVNNIKEQFRNQQVSFDQFLSDINNAVETATRNRIIAEGLSKSLGK